MRLAPALAAAAVLAGCDNPPAGDTPSSPVGGGPVGGGPVGGNAANMVEEVSPRGAGDLPPPSEGLRFIGKWAANERSCESAAWQFTQTTLRTPAGAVCGFDRVTQVPGGYDIQATCTAQAPPASDTLKIRFAESSKAMLFESESIADDGLVFCGRDA